MDPFLKCLLNLGSLSPINESKRQEFIVRLEKCTEDKKDKEYIKLRKDINKFILGYLTRR